MVQKLSKGHVVVSEIINAEWLTQKVEGKHGTQTALADYLGLDRDKVNKMVKGRRGISQAEARKIHEFFTNQFDELSELDDNEIRSAISARLREARIAAGFSTAQSAAAALGMGATTYRHHENGGRGIKPAEAIRYAEFYDFSLDWLYTGKASPYTYDKTSNLPVDAERSIAAIARAFDPSVVVLALSRREYEIINEAADIFVRLNGPDPKRSADAEILSRFFMSKPQIPKDETDTSRNM